MSWKCRGIVNGGSGEDAFHMTAKYSGNVLSHVLTLERREQSVWLSWEWCTWSLWFEIWKLPRISISDLKSMAVEKVSLPLRVCTVWGAFLRRWVKAGGIIYDIINYCTRELKKTVNEILARLRDKKNKTDMSGKDLLRGEDISRKIKAERKHFAL